jgi:predicted PurR-regulated permease PerM
MEGLIVAAIVINTIVLICIILGLIIFGKRILQVIKALKTTLDEINRELHPTLQTAQNALKSVESLVSKLEQQEIPKLDSILVSIDKIVSGSIIVQAASSAMKTTRSTLSGVLAGIKEGLRLMKERMDSNKEE